MDAMERMALDLELAQYYRHKRSKNKDDFWTPEELTIYESIQTIRSASRTYVPEE